MTNEVIFSKEQLDEIISDVAEKLNARFENQTSIPVFISVLKGAEPFFNDLIKKCHFEMKIDFIQVSSYSGTSSTGVIHLKKDITEDIKGKDVYIVEDIMTCDTQKFARKLLEKYGIFDVVVHNVGGSLVSRDHLAGAEEWQYALKFNALASIDMNSVLIPPMIERGYGRVIHISSISAVMLRGNPLYASAKAFLNAYVTTVGRQLAPTGVLLCSVMPGAVAFPGSYWDKFVKEGHPRVDDFLRHHQAVNRFGTPEEIANAVVFMASDKSSFMQATNIPVDGANM